MSNTYWCSFTYGSVWLEVAESAAGRVVLLQLFSIHGGAVGMKDLDVMLLWVIGCNATQCEGSLKLCLHLVRNHSTMSQILILQMDHITGSFACTPGHDMDASKNDALWQLTGLALGSGFSKSPGLVGSDFSSHNQIKSSLIYWFPQTYKMHVFTVNFHSCKSIRVKFLVPDRAQSVYAHTQVGTALL